MWEYSAKVRRESRFSGRVVEMLAAIEKAKGHGDPIVKELDRMLRSGGSDVEALNRTYKKIHECITEKYPDLLAYMPKE